MWISTRGRYGIRAMLELALNYDKGSLRLRDIARGQDISPKYLEHFLTPLKLAGLIRSIRGAQGGYELARSPSQIRLSDILLVLEGTMAPVECVDRPEICSRYPSCAAREVWSELKKSVLDPLESTTLQDLVDRQVEIWNLNERSLTR